MPLNLELRGPFDLSDKPDDAQRAIIHKHLKALSAELGELGEDIYVAALLDSRFYPDTLYTDAELYDKQAGTTALQFIKTNKSEYKEEALRLSIKADTTRHVSDSLRKSLYDAFRVIEAKG